MATISSASYSSPAESRVGQPNFLDEIRTFGRQFVARVFDPYRPELHYMRGPGPAWHAKQTAASRQRSN